MAVITIRCIICKCVSKHDFNDDYELVRRNWHVCKIQDIDNNITLYGDVCDQCYHGIFSK